VLDLVSFIESEFKVGVSDEELTPENFQTIDRMAAFVEAKRVNGE
jgi:acyl carrier protein